MWRTAEGFGPRGTDGTQGLMSTLTTPAKRLRVMMVVTRAEAGGAQVHVRDLVEGLSAVLDPLLVVGDEGFLADEARRLDVPVRVLPELVRELSPRKDVAAVRRLRELVVQLRPDLVHTHSSKAGLLGRLAARLAGVPAVHTAHSWAFSDGVSRKRKAFAVPTEAMAALWTRRFIVVSEADREVGLRYGVARQAQLRVVHNGVRDSLLRARPDAAGVPVITMVARMAAPKDHGLLLQALAEIRAPFRLRLVGDGPLRGQVEAMITNLRLDTKVELLGARLDVDALLADSQIAALLSVQEGFPLVVLEGMRAGLPVVASDVGGVREAVSHGRTGFLVPRGDVVALRAHLETLLGDPKLRESMGRQGRRDYEQHFSVTGMVERTIEVYRELSPRFADALSGPQGSPLTQRFA